MISLGLLFIFLLMACDEEEVWEELQDEEVTEEIILFMHDYKDAWQESLSTQTYSIMEAYFVGNSQIFHMERKQHQELTGARITEKLEEVSDILVEVNQFDEFRVYWSETVEIEQIESVYEETRARRYYMSEGRNGFQVTAIERSDEINEHSL